MRDNKRLLYITLTALIILNIATYFSLKNMKQDFESRLNNLSNQVINLNTQMNSQAGYINQALDKFKQDQKWTSGSSYKLLEYNSTTKLVKVQVNWSLRELSSNSKVYLSYGEKELKTGSVGRWDRTEAMGMDNLNYKAEVYLSPEKNYKLKVQSEGSEGSKGEDLMDVDLITAIKDRFGIVQGMYGRQGPKYENHAYVINRSEGQDFLKIRSVTAKVYVKGNLENTIELHKAAPGEVKTDEVLKFGSNIDNEVWLNDDVIWIKGEENWVKTGENSWANKSGNLLPRPDEVRIDVTIVDKMGMTYTKSSGR